MKSMTQPHHLLILSQHAETYKLLIEEEKLPGLYLAAFSEPDRVKDTGVRFDLVFGEPALISKVLHRLPYLKWVQSSWAGVEPLLKPDLRNDYMLTNIRNVYGPMMSEYVFGYLLLIERQILPRWQSQRRGEWDTRPYTSLGGKRLGLLGVGTIGAHLAATARHFGMQVYAYTRQSEKCQDVEKYFHAKNWRDFAATLDYLVCSLPGTAATERIVNADFIATLPGKAWVVNIGRGSAIDEKALVNALNKGSIAGAILDVFTEEPLPRGHPLWSTPNTFITAHTAARNVPADIVKVFIDNYRRFIVGESLLYQVSFDLGY